MQRIAQVFLAVVLITAFLCSPAAADTQAERELTLHEAIDLALKNSKELRKARLDVERTRELRAHQSEQLDYIPLGISGNPVVESAWYSLLMADLNLQMSIRSRSIQEDKVVLDVCQKYWDVLQARGKVAAKEKSLEQAEWEWRKARASAQVGLINPHTLSKAEAGHAAAEAELAKAENELAQAYTRLNQLIGLGSGNRPILVDDVEYSPTSVPNVETAVQRVINQSPAVLLAQERATMQKYLENIMFYSGEYRPYQARKIEVEQAELDAMSAADLTRLLTRTLYYRLTNLEEDYPTLEEAVKIAQEDLRLTKLKYDLGMVTKADVAAAEAALANMEHNLLYLKCQHAYLKLAVEKPWAVSLE